MGINLNSIFGRNGSNVVPADDHIQPEAPAVRPDAPVASSAASSNIISGGDNMVGQFRGDLKTVGAVREFDMGLDELAALPLPDGTISLFNDFVERDGKWELSLPTSPIVFTSNQDAWQKKMIKGGPVRWVKSRSAIQMAELGAAIWIAANFNAIEGGRDMLDGYGVEGDFDFCHIFTAQSNPLIERLIAYKGNSVTVFDVQHKLNMTRTREVFIEGTWVRPGLAQAGIAHRVEKTNQFLRDNVDPDAVGISAADIMTRWELASFLTDGFQLVHRQPRMKVAGGELQTFESLREQFTAIPEGSKKSKMDHLVEGYRMQAAKDNGVDLWVALYGKQEA